MIGARELTKQLHDIVMEKGGPGSGPHAGAGSAKEQQAASRKASLKEKSKKEVFAIWTRTTLGRVHNANIAEQNKAWMAHDILVAEYGKDIASAVDR
jgi:hypothetical protein